MRNPFRRAVRKVLKELRKEAKEIEDTYGPQEDNHKITHKYAKEVLEDTFSEDAVTKLKNPDYNPTVDELNTLISEEFSPPLHDQVLQVSEDFSPVPAAQVIPPLIEDVDDNYLCLNSDFVVADPPDAPYVKNIISIEYWQMYAPSQDQPLLFYSWGVFELDLVWNPDKGEWEVKDIHKICDLNEVVYGTNHTDLIYTQGGEDIIFGYGGDDQIQGGPGFDIIVGGDGDDILWGGTGPDWFYSIKGETGADVIVDYSYEEGDLLVFTDLIDDSENINLDNIGDYVKTVEHGENRNIFVDADGKGSHENWDKIALLHDVPLINVLIDGDVFTIDTTVM